MLRYDQGLGVVRDRATRIQSLLRQAVPSKTFGPWTFKLDEFGHPRAARDFVLVHADLTDRQVAVVRDAIVPAPKDMIITLLTWLAVHKRMDSDQKKQKILFSDMAHLLHGVPEYALALAIVDLIESDQSDWFPNVAKIKAAVAVYQVSGVLLKSDAETAGQVAAS